MSKWGTVKQIDRTVSTLNLSTGDQAVICLPPNYSAAVGARAVIWMHGAGGDQTTPFLNVDTTAAMSDAMLNAGLIVASCHSHSPTHFSNATAISDVEALATKLRADYNITSIGLVGQSMGGLLALNLYKTNTVNAKYAYCISGVCDLRKFSDGNSSFAANIATSYAMVSGTISAALSAGATSVSSSVSFPNGTVTAIGGGAANSENVTVNGAPSGAGPFTLPITATTNSHSSGAKITDYPVKTSGFDPILAAQSSWTGKSLRFVAAPGDATVTKTAHSDAMAARVSGFAVEGAVVTASGGHLSDPSQFDFSDFYPFHLRASAL